MKHVILKNLTIIKHHFHNSLYKNSFFLMINSLTSIGTGFIFLLIATRCYSPYDIGLANAIFAAMTMLVLLSTLGFDFGLIRYLPAENDKKKMINTCFTITSICSVFFSLIFIFGISLWSPALIILKENKTIFICFILFTIASSVFTLQNSVFIANREAKYKLFINLITSIRIAILPFLITLGMLGIYLSNGIAIIIALIAGNLLTIWVFPGYKPVPVIKKTVFNRLFHFSFGNYIANILDNLPDVVMPLLILNV